MIVPPTKRIFATATIVVFLLGGAAFSLRGHESPEHEVEALTLRMTRIGKTPSLLGRRAAEYKALGELDKAAADLSEAITLDPKAPETYAELSKVQFAQEKLNDAYENATRSLALMEDGADRGPMYLLRAQIQSARGHAAEALTDCEFADRKDDQDWYVVRAEAQEQLGKLDERAAGLKAGYDRNGSIVLEIEWIEAMIDAGQFRPALERIDKHLNQLRLRSSWLLRRARALKGLRRDFQSDTQAALAELDRRLNPERPEPTLLVDRATAFALLGKAESAKADLALAKKHGMPALACARVEAILKAALAASDSPGSRAR